MKLRECPNCESTYVGIRELNGGPGIGIDGYYVSCGKCMMCGPVETEEDAPLAWNQLPRRGDGEAGRLRTALAVRDRILSPIIALADAGDYAAPVKYSVSDARKIKEELKNANV